MTVYTHVSGGAKNLSHWHCRPYYTYSPCLK